ncbi:phage integrase N-terminal SAM-like domain-containing protein [Halomonas korlensis]
MDRVKATIRVKRYSPRTEKTYCYWIQPLHPFPWRATPCQHGSQ